MINLILNLRSSDGAEHRLVLNNIKEAPSQQEADDALDAIAALDALRNDTAIYFQIPLTATVITTTTDVIVNRFPENAA